jgi:hypothetical protein
MSVPSKSKRSRSRTFSVLVLAEAHLLARRLVGGERHDLVDRELALGQDLEELVADGAGGAHDGDLVAHDGGPLREGTRRT